MLGSSTEQTAAWRSGRVPSSQVPGGGKGTCLSNATTGRATARSVSPCATREACSYRFQGKQAKEFARTGRVAAVSILGTCRQSPRSVPLRSQATLELTLGGIGGIG